MKASNKPNAPNAALIRDSQLASFIGVSKRTLRAWREMGLIPFLKVRSLILYDPNEVLQTLKKFKREVK
jgi:DNA-binding transcriptional MerR regulator